MPWNRKKDPMVMWWKLWTFFVPKMNSEATPRVRTRTLVRLSKGKMKPCWPLCLLVYLDRQIVLQQQRWRVKRMPI